MEDNNIQTESLHKDERFNKWLDEIFDHDKIMGFKWRNLLNEFLWLCAGANRKVLRQCPTEHAKYAGIGGTILFTAILATFSGGYAIYKVFADEVLNEDTQMYITDIHAVYIAIAFGIIWGLMIFNLDRFMVNTMFSDGTHKITDEEWKGARPRLILAIFIGIVISTPVELRLFKDKIQIQLRQDQIAEKQKMDRGHSILDSEILKIETDKSKNNERLDKKREELANAEESLYNETVGIKGTQKFGYGPAAKMLQRNVNRLKLEVEKLEKEVSEANSSIDKRLESKYKERNISTIKDNEAEKSMKGFAAELKALNTITIPWKDPALFIARLLIMCLFIAIEVIPTIFKLMMIDGAYDAVLALEKHRAKVIAKKQESDINDIINTDIKISTEKNLQRREAEILANKELMEKIAKTQTELLNTAIEKWREEELAKINVNPSAYIKVNN
ncbi:MAG: DUF4407 domain-containing protein [Prevotella sp.]|nr:DUF4407 domain-containing protein [Prevotella sp.]